MATPRSLRIAVLVALCLVAVAASDAAAARRGATRPAITSIGPASVAVGDTLTIRGRGFLPGRRRDAVSFTRAGGPAVTVKATDATRTRIRVVVPKTLARYLSDTQPTRFGVRVRARRSSKVSTARRQSVLVLSPAALQALDDATGDCTTTDPVDDATDTLDDTLGDTPGTDLGDTLDDVLPSDGCDPASAADDDPGTGAGGADPPDTDATDPPDPSGADDTISG